MPLYTLAEAETAANNDTLITYPTAGYGFIYDAARGVNQYILSFQKSPFVLGVQDAVVPLTLAADVVTAQSTADAAMADYDTGTSAEMLASSARQWGVTEAGESYGTHWYDDVLTAWVKVSEDIQVDQTYDPAGTGATSNIAVAEGIAVVSDSLIATAGIDLTAAPYNVPTDETSDCAAAINAAVSGTTGEVILVLPAGRDYVLTSRVTLRDNVTLIMYGATIKPSAALTNSAIYATGRTGVKIMGGTVEGIGTAPGTFVEHLVELHTCTDSTIADVKVTKSRQDGFRLMSCTNVSVIRSVAVNNYAIGFQDRDGIGNTFDHCTGSYNGSTGVIADTTSGRGLMAWRSVGTRVRHSTFTNNTEYGLRVYSENAEVDPSKDIRVISSVAKDNRATDFYVFNASGLVSDIRFIDCEVTRTTEPDAPVIALQGDDVQWIRGRVEKIGTRLVQPTFSLYALSNAKITGVKGINLKGACSWSASAICSDVLIHDNDFDCADIGQLYGTNVRIIGNRLKHGGVGTTDIAIKPVAGYNPVINDNLFDGFYRNVEWSTSSVEMRNNRAKNTTDVCLRWYGTDITTLILVNNEWDTSSNPGIIANLQRVGGSGSRATAYSTAAPTTLTWVVGDRVIKATPTIGAEKSWVCTTAGTPGTWTSEGNL